MTPVLVVGCETRPISFELRKRKRYPKTFDTYPWHVFEIFRMGRHSVWQVLAKKTYIDNLSCQDIFLLDDLNPRKYNPRIYLRQILLVLVVFVVVVVVLVSLNVQLVGFDRKM